MCKVERFQTLSVNILRVDAFVFQIKQIIVQINFIEEQLKELESEISMFLYRTNQVITTITEDKGVFELGLSTIQFPAAKAGAIFHVAIKNG